MKTAGQEPGKRARLGGVMDDCSPQRKRASTGKYDGFGLSVASEGGARLQPVAKVVATG